MDWVTVSSLATAGGTLVLAVATFSSTRSATRTARAAERSLQIGLRPVLMPSRRVDPPQRIMYGDEQWFKLPGGTAIGEIRNMNGVDTVYLAISLHNAGSGLAVIHGWRFHPQRPRGAAQQHPPTEEFRPNVRDLYVPVNDTSFWQAAFRDPEDAGYAAARDAIKARRPVGVDLLYGDHEGGQRVITRFSVVPREPGTPPLAGDGGSDGGPAAGYLDALWIPSVVRHWNVDRPDPR